jgi:hypothetical protein
MCIIEIQPRNGGEDARHCAERLADALSAHATRLGVTGISAEATTRAISVSLPRYPAGGLT